MLEYVTHNNDFLRLRGNLYETVIKIQEHVIEGRWAGTVGDQ